MHFPLIANHFFFSKWRLVSFESGIACLSLLSLSGAVAWVELTKLPGGRSILFTIVLASLILAFVGSALCD
jgi:hypothetical protein